MVISLLCVLFTTNAFAYDFTYKVGSDTYYFNILDKTAKTVEVTSDEDEYYLKNNSYPRSGTYIIPSQVTYNGTTYTVTKIGPYAFCKCTAMKKVQIPNTVTKIDVNAFYVCSGLQEVVWSTKLTSIETYAFYGCSSLESIDFPQSLTYIGKLGFYGCSSLKSLRLPPVLQVLGKEAFSSCTALKTVYINEILNIGENPFSGTHNVSEVHYGASTSAWIIKQNYSFPEWRNATLIYEGSADLSKEGIFPNFRNTVFTKFVINPATTTNLEVPLGNPNMEELTIPSGAKVAFIDPGVFKGCEKLSSLNIECGDYRGDGNMLFRNISTGSFVEWAFICAAPTKPYLLIPSHPSFSGGPVTKIYDHALNGYNFTYVEIPESVKSIGNDAFTFKDQKTIYIKSDNIESPGTMFDSGWNLNDYPEFFRVILAKQKVIGQLQAVWGTQGTYIPIDAASSSNDEDVNNDGKVNATDAMQIYNYILSH